MPRWQPTGKERKEYEHINTAADGKTISDSNHSDMEKILTNSTNIATGFSHNIAITSVNIPVLTDQFPYYVIWHLASPDTRQWPSRLTIWVRYPGSVVDSSIHQSALSLSADDYRHLQLILLPSQFRRFPNHQSTHMLSQYRWLPKSPTDLHESQFRWLPELPNTHPSSSCPNRRQLRHSPINSSQNTQNATTLLREDYISSQPAT